MPWKKLMEYPWPGNVRELENAIEHAFVLCSSPQIKTRDLPLEIREKRECAGAPSEKSNSPISGAKEIPQSKLNREALVNLLHECGLEQSRSGATYRKEQNLCLEIHEKMGYCPAASK